MNTEKFIKLLKLIERRKIINSIKDTLETKDIPIYDKNIKNIINYYNKKSDEEKIKLFDIIEMSVDQAIFGLLCVIDGVSFIENSQEKGEFQLIYKKYNKSILLNNLKEGELLHEYYNIE